MARFQEWQASQPDVFITAGAAVGRPGGMLMRREGRGPGGPDAVGQQDIRTFEFSGGGQRIIIQEAEAVPASPQP